VSDGYWASEQNIYGGFEYLDRGGRLFCAEECREELAEYRRNSESFARRHEKPDGFREKMYEAQAKGHMAAYYGVRAARSLRRRIAGKQ